jgi:hypothetical protein
MQRDSCRGFLLRQYFFTAQRKIPLNRVKKFPLNRVKKIRSSGLRKKKHTSLLEIIFWFIFTSFYIIFLPKSGNGSGTEKRSNLLSCFHASTGRLSVHPEHKKCLVVVWVCEEEPAAVGCCSWGRRSLRRSCSSWREVWLARFLCFVKNKLLVPKNFFFSSHWMSVPVGRTGCYEIKSRCKG